MKNLFKTLSYLLFLLSAVSAMAQKLPNAQRIEIFAPNDINIDGHATEWKDKFQAYNLNNRMYYTISNDGNNLYLTVRAGDAYSNEKALYGVEFKIQLPDVKKSKAEEVKIIFPKYNGKTDDLRFLLSPFRSLEKGKTTGNKGRIDTLRLMANKALGAAYKEIIVSGIKSLDPVSPIDNKEGIKVAAQFNPPLQYTYELAIPLKYLGASINSGQKFKYNITMMGQPDVSSNGMARPVLINANSPGYLSSDLGFVTMPTDFWGSYTLARK